MILGGGGERAAEVTRLIPLEDGLRVELTLEHGRLYCVAAFPARGWASASRARRWRRTVPGMRLSARNQLPATITNITEGPATAVVELDCNGLRLVASITVDAAHDLGLAVGKEVTAVVKASDVMVGVAD